MMDAKLQNFVERIERLEEEQRGIGGDKRDVYGEVKDAQYNTKAVRKIVAERRMKDRAEITEAMDGYRVALGMAAEAVNGGMSLDDAKEAYGFSRSAIHRASHSGKNSLSGTDEEIRAKTTPAKFMPCSGVWQEITAARTDHEARIAAEKEATRAKRRAEQAALAARNAEIDADELHFPVHLDRRQVEA